MFRARPLVLPFVALALSAAVVHAQERPNGFYLTSPLSLSAGYDQGFVTGSGTFNDMVTILTAPTFAWMLTTHRTDFSVEYQPEFELFADNPSLDAWNHAATLRYRYRINARWGLEAGNMFLSTEDASRAVANSLLLLPRGRFLQNTAYAALNYRVNEATKLSFRLDNAFTNTDLPGAFAGRLDGVTTAGTVTLDRVVTSRQKLTGSYSFLHSHPLQPGVSGNAINVNLLNAGYAFEVNPGLIVRLAGGVVRGSESSYIGSAAAEKRLGGIWLAAGYQRYLSFLGGFTPLGSAAPAAAGFANGLTPNSVYQVASVHIWGQLSRRFGWEGVAQRALNGADPVFGTIKSVIIQTKLSYKVTDRVSWFVRLEHYGENANPAFETTALSRNRYFTGLEFTLSRPPEPANAPNRHIAPAPDVDKTNELPPEEK